MPAERGPGPSPAQGTKSTSTRPPVVAAPVAPEKYVTFPLLGSLLDDDAKSDQLASVFRCLYGILDERRASYVQGTMQLVLEAGSAERLAEQLRALGLNVTVRDQ